jgi:hypothetical protein
MYTPSATELEIHRLVSALVHYLEGHSAVYCCFHVVLGDGNRGKESIAFCCAYARNEKCRVCIPIADALESLPAEQWIDALEGIHAPDIDEAAALHFLETDCMCNCSRPFDYRCYHPVPKRDGTCPNCHKRLRILDGNYWAVSGTAGEFLKYERGSLENTKYWLMHDIHPWSDGSDEFSEDWSEARIAIDRRILLNCIQMRLAQICALPTRPDV